MTVKPKNLKDIRDRVATQTVTGDASAAKKKKKKAKPKSVTLIGPEDECSYEDVLRQEKDDADACPEGGDVPK